METKTIKECGSVFHIQEDLVTKDFHIYEITNPKTKHEMKEYQNTVSSKEVAEKWVYKVIKVRNKQ